MTPMKRLTTIQPHDAATGVARGFGLGGLSRAVIGGLAANARRRSPRANP
jgi:hypothetical protein